MPSIGSTPGIIVGAGVGGAASIALRPAFEIPTQDAWARKPNRILDVGTLARLVAQGGVLLGDPDGKTKGSAYAEALRQGYGPDKLDRLIYLSQAAPDLALLIEIWRRGLLGEPTAKDTLAQVDHGLAKAQIEPQWWDALKDLFSGRLDPALIATMVQRSILPNVKDPATGELILPGQPSTKGSNVPPMPQVDLDPLVEARAHGINFPRIAAEARIVGLPASADLAARMHFREIITEGAYNQAILEGNTRGEWAPFLLDGFRQILTANQYAELQLRGFLNAKQRVKQTDKHGMSEADSDLLFNLLGRSIPVHQITTGAARGGKFDGAWDTIPKAYLSSLQRGNLRPEFYDLAYHNRYSYPSAFFFRLLLTQGTLTAAEGEQAFLDIGWSPKWAKLIANGLAPKAAAATVSTPARLATSQARAALHKRFLVDRIDSAGVLTGLELIGSDAAEAGHILEMWTLERGWLVKPLTPSQIKKLYKEGTLSIDEAADALIELHMTDADARAFLQS